MLHKYLTGIYTDSMTSPYEHLSEKQREALCKRYGHKFSYWMVILKEKCDRCGILAEQYAQDVHRKPMTEQEKRLISFYGNERKWHEDILSRRVVPAHLRHKYGGVIRVKPGQGVPWA